MALAGRGAVVPPVTDEVDGRDSQAGVVDLDVSAHFDDSLCAETDALLWNFCIFGG